MRFTSQKHEFHIFLRGYIACLTINFTLYVYYIKQQDIIEYKNNKKKKKFKRGKNKKHHIDELEQPKLYNTTSSRVLYEYSKLIMEQSIYTTWPSENTLYVYYANSSLLLRSLVASALGHAGFALGRACSSRWAALWAAHSCAWSVCDFVPTGRTWRFAPPSHPTTIWDLCMVSWIK